MSYEGYERWLCWSGHLHHFDCYLAPSSSDWRCPYCGETRAWMEQVDQTNDNGNPSKLRKAKAPCHETKCPVCEGRGLVAVPRYVIPRRKTKRSTTGTEGGEG